MADYRERLDEVIVAARHNVYVSGSGFDSSPKGERQAFTYAAALRSAIQMPRQFGTHRADIASTAVFIKGHPVLAREVRDRIIEFTTDPQRARRVTTAEAAAGFFRASTSSPMTPP